MKDQRSKILRRLDFMTFSCRSGTCSLVMLWMARFASGWSFGNGRFAWLSNCNGHGSYSFQTRSCDCEDGWGGAGDVSIAKSPRCDVRICPAGPSLASIPSTTTAAHAMRECSDVGACNRDTGECDCYGGFAGRACQRCKCMGARCSYVTFNFFAKSLN